MFLYVLFHLTLLHKIFSYSSFNLMHLILMLPRFLFASKNQEKYSRICYCYLPLTSTMKSAHVFILPHDFTSHIIKRALFSLVYLTPSNKNSNVFSFLQDFLICFNSHVHKINKNANKTTFTHKVFLIYTKYSHVYQFASWIHIKHHAYIRKQCMKDIFSNLSVAGLYPIFLKSLCALQCLKLLITH